MNVKEIAPNIFSISIKGEEFFQLDADDEESAIRSANRQLNRIGWKPGTSLENSDRNLLHRMNFGGNRNWSNKDYEDREVKIDRILEMNPGI